MDHRRALAWFAAEHPVLLAAVRTAISSGFDVHGWQLPWTLAPFLKRRGRWQDAAEIQGTGLAAARRLGDSPAQAETHRGIGTSCVKLGRADDALSHFRQALDLYGADGTGGTEVGRARIHLGIGSLYGQQGSHASALREGRRALHLFRVARHRAGQARTLNTIGWHQTMLGDLRQALVSCHQALGLHQEIGDRRGEADTWDSIGYAYHQLRRCPQALTCYRLALDRWRELGDRPGEAQTLVHIGETLHSAGDPDAARAEWQRALAILDELDHPEADRLRARVATS